MDAFNRRLAKAKTIGLDTSIFIYMMEDHPRYGPLAKNILEGMESAKWIGVTSTITLMEITVRPWQLGRETAAREYEAVLSHYPNLTIIDVDKTVARRAAQLRAKYSISPPDALQLATSLNSGAGVFVTNDKRLSKIQEFIEILVLEDFVVE
jgi:predicted nucleic acid-binding protein